MNAAAPPGSGTDARRSSPVDTSVPPSVEPSVRPPADPGAPPAVHVGRIITATVDDLTDREIVLKMVDGRPGVVMRRDVEDADGKVPAVGDSIDVALLAREDPQGRVATSRGWAVKQRAWQRIDAARSSGAALLVTVLKQVKGGLLVDLGLRAFLPASQAFEDRSGELSELVGTEVEVRVTEVDRDRDRVVVSRRDVLRSQRRAEERSAFDRLEVGATVTGRVVAMTDYGALVDLAGARGLLHRTEMSWSRVATMENHAQPGQELKLVVIELNRSKRRIGLSLRRLADDPLPTLEEGVVSDATISRLVDYGAFAELPSGLEGLVHLSEMAEGRGFRPEELVAPGERVRVMVVGIDRKRRRLDLSMTRAAMAAP
ncbi:MAG: 30S ribosomal protein S1 [Candidatus Microthrix sp.]|nr:30S ribosomal protein S1 [Candidatus Microthrix sp.]